MPYQEWFGLTFMLPCSAIKFVLSDIKCFHPHVKKMARTTLASLQVNSDVVTYNPIQKSHIQHSGMSLLFKGIYGLATWLFKRSERMKFWGVI